MFRSTRITIACILLALPMAAVAQKGKVAVYADGTWGCKGAGGTIIDPGPNGTWTTTSSPPAVGNPCWPSARIANGGGSANVRQTTEYERSGAFETGGDFNNIGPAPTFDRSKR